MRFQHFLARDVHPLIPGIDMASVYSKGYWVSKENSVNEIMRVEYSNIRVENTQHDLRITLLRWCSVARLIFPA